MKDSCDHGVSLVNQLCEGLFLIDSAKNHLMLALLSHIFDARCVHVIPRSHRRDLDPAVRDALCSDELLVELAGSF